MASDASVKLLQEFLRRRAGASVVRLRDLAEPPDVVFTGVFISPVGHLLTAYHALESRLLDVGYLEQFEVAFEFDPAWLPGGLRAGPLRTIARCEPGWRDAVADVAILKLSYEPPAYLPISAHCDPEILLGSPLRAYGFTVTQHGIPSLGEVEGSYLRALPEQRRFRITGVVRGEGQSGGPVIDMQSRMVVGAVVGFFQKEINTGDAAAVSRGLLETLGLRLDFGDLENRWRRDAALYLRGKHPQFQFLLPERHVPELPDKYLRGRTKARNVLGLLAKQEYSTILLHGAPGSGKTSVALEVAQELQVAGTVESVFWHDFYSEENRSAQQLIRRLGLYLLEENSRFEIVESYPANPSPEDDDLAASVIAETIRSSRHLLVFDNVQFLQREGRPELLSLLDKVMQAAGGGKTRVLLASWDVCDSPLVNHVERMDGFTSSEVGDLLRLYGVEATPEVFSIIDDYRHDITCLELLIRRPEWLADLTRLGRRPSEPRELHRHWLTKYREHLPVPARRVLLALAVLSEPSEAGALEEVAGVEDFHVTVEALQTSPPLVEFDSQDGVHHYYLHHNVKRAFVAISDHKDVIQIHRRAAEYFTKIGKRALPAARHWCEAHEFGRAIDVLYGKHEEIISGGEVEDLSRLADTISGDAVDVLYGRYKLNVVLGSCRNVRGLYGEAEDYWQFALEDSPTAIDTATVRNRRADSFRLSSDYEHAREEYELAMEVAVGGFGGKFRSQIGRANLGLAKLDRLAADYRDAHVRYGEAHRAFKSTFDEVGLIEAEFGIGEVTRLMRQLEESEEWYSKSLRRAHRLGNLERQAYALWGVGEVQRLTARHDEAAATHLRGFELCVRMGDTRSEGWALLGLAEVHRCVGQTSEALVAYDSAMQKFTQTQSDTEIAHALLGLAEAHRSKGRVELKHYEHVEATYRRKRLRHSLTLCLLAKGSALMQLGKRQAADIAFAEAGVLADTCSLQHEAELAVLLRGQSDPTAAILLNFP
jgi:tetratricopeptide (TPR) repeat protein